MRKGEIPADWKTDPAWRVLEEQGSQRALQGCAEHGRSPSGSGIRSCLLRTARHQGGALGPWTTCGSCLGDPFRSGRAAASLLFSGLGISDKAESKQKHQASWTRVHTGLQLLLRQNSISHAPASVE